MRKKKVANLIAGVAAFFEKYRCGKIGKNTANGHIEKNRSKMSIKNAANGHIEKTEAKCPQNPEKLDIWEINGKKIQ